MDHHYRVGVFGASGFAGAELLRLLAGHPAFDVMAATETLDIARMVLVGKVNRDIVSAINVHAPLAVGVSGEDAGLITAMMGA